jgi:hypothetical protein
MISLKDQILNLLATSDWITWTTHELCALFDDFPKSSVRARICELVAEGLILRTQRTINGKTYSVHRHKERAAAIVGSSPFRAQAPVVLPSRPPGIFTRIFGWLRYVFSPA